MEQNFETTKSFDGPAGNEYARLTALREAERAEAIRSGQIDDPEKPKALEEAQVFLGTCRDMCPLYEREQREYQNDVKKWEVNQATGRIDKDLAVKAFHRPAAGNEQALPSDVRPPQVLSATLDYLIDRVVSPCDPLDKDTHGFVRDRTRSIRQDFTLQNERGQQAIKCHERIVRFHILSLHHMCEVDGFDMHQELEQLRKTLQSLAEYYDDQRINGTQQDGEAEFRAYHILTRLRDPDVLRYVQLLPQALRQSLPVAQALKLYQFAQRSNEEIGRFKPPNCEGAQNLYSKFFKTLREDRTSYLMACICETQFNDVRKGSLKAMRKAFITHIKTPSVASLTALLGCDDGDEVERQCEQYGIIVRADEDDIARPMLNKSVQFNESRPDMKQKFSKSLVERKRCGQSFASIINGSTIAPPLSSFPTFNGITAAHKDHNAQFPLIEKSSRRPEPMLAMNKRVAFSLPSHVFAAPKSVGSVRKSGYERNEAQNKSSTPPQLELTCRDSHVNMGTVVNPTSGNSTAASTNPSYNFEVPIVRANMPARHDRTEELRHNVLQKSAAQTSHQGLTKQLVESLSSNLVQGLIRDQLLTVVCETYADHLCNKWTFRAAWRAVVRASRNVQRRNKLRLEEQLAEIKRQEDYSRAFKELQVNNKSTTRKRSRSSMSIPSNATVMSILHAKDIAERFWRPIDLATLLEEVRLHDPDDVWQLLIFSDSKDRDPVTQWLESKFGLEHGTRMLRDQSNAAIRFVVDLHRSIRADAIGQVGALIFVSTSDQPEEQSRFLSLLQHIAEISNRCFPILVLRFNEIEKEDSLATRLMISDVLSDRKSPVTACHYAQIETIKDVAQFERNLQLLIQSTSDALSPLALDRKVAREREDRRTTLKTSLSQESLVSPLKSKSRSSFFDSTVVSQVEQLHITKAGRLDKRVVVPRQVSELMQTLQNARNLLKGPSAS